MRIKELLIYLFMFLPIAMFAQKDGQKYVEVCGIKWATGNICYEDGKWKTSQKQWHRVGLNRNQSPNWITHFNFGEVTTTHDSGAYYFNDKTKSICGTRFDIATTRLGKEWRLPTKGEFDILMKKADICWGRYYYKDNSYISGIYFSNPKDKKRTKNKKQIVTLTDTDMENGLFLPACGYRGVQTKWIFCNEYGHTRFFDIEYWTGDLYGGDGYYFGTNDYPNAMMKMWFIDGGKNGIGNIGRPIRPVYVGAE